MGEQYSTNEPKKKRKKKGGKKKRGRENKKKWGETAFNICTQVLWSALLSSTVEKSGEG